MNREFLGRMMWEAHYILKSGTNASYIWAPFAQVDRIADAKARKEATAELIAKNRREGWKMLLPFRLYFIQEDAAPVAFTGRGTRKKVAQLKAHFTTCEESPYKIAKPYKVCTSVWEVPGTKCFFYGTIGINLVEGTKPIDNGDLVIFHTAGWKDVGIYIFKGLAKPNEVASLQEVVAFVESIAIRG